MKKRDDEDSTFLNDIQNDEANRERKERRVTKIHEHMSCVGETARRINTEKKHERRTRLCSNEEQDPRMMCIG